MKAYSQLLELSEQFEENQSFKVNMQTLKIIEMNDDDARFFKDLLKQGLQKESIQLKKELDLLKEKITGDPHELIY